MQSNKSPPSIFFPAFILHSSVQSTGCWTPGDLGPMNKITDILIVNFCRQIPPTAVIWFCHVTTTDHHYVLLSTPPSPCYLLCYPLNIWSLDISWQRSAKKWTTLQTPPPKSHYPRLFCCSLSLFFCFLLPLILLPPHPSSISISFVLILFLYLFWFFSFHFLKNLFSFFLFYDHFFQLFSFRFLFNQFFRRILFFSVIFLLFSFKNFLPSISLCIPCKSVSHLTLTHCYSYLHPKLPFFFLFFFSISLDLKHLYWFFKFTSSKSTLTDCFAFYIHCMFAEFTLDHKNPMTTITKKIFQWPMSSCWRSNDVFVGGRHLYRSD